MKAGNDRFRCPLCESCETQLFFLDEKNYQHTYYRCVICDVVFVSPDCRLDRSAEKARYDMHNNTYSEAYVKFLSRLATPMLDVLSPKAKGLDFGSGNSQVMADLFRDQGHRCDCYDIFYYPDNQLLKQRYDYIVASEVIEHLYAPKMIIEQWLAMLKPNGFLGIMTGIRPTNQAFADWWYKNDPTHVMLFSKQTFDYLRKRYRLNGVFQQGNVLIFKK